MNGGRTLKLLLLCAVLVCAGPASAGVCSDYLREVWKSRGVRLFVLPERDPPPEPETFYGFASPSGWPTPLNGLHNVLVERPASATVRVFAGPKTRAAFWAKLPFIVGWALLAQVYVIDPVTDGIYERRVQSEVARNKGEYTRLIAEDFRFDPVRKALASGAITPDEGERQAYMIGHAYSSYYKYRDGRRAVFSAKENRELLSHYLFAHLTPVIDGPVQVPSGFRALPGFSPALSEPQVERLFSLTHALYLRYQIIEAFVAGSPDENLRSFLDEIAADPFTRRAVARAGASRAGLKRALQEHAFWDYRLKCHAVMNLQKLRSTGQAPATLADHDAEILAELGA